MVVVFRVYSDELADGLDVECVGDYVDGLDLLDSVAGLDHLLCIARKGGWIAEGVDDEWDGFVGAVECLLPHTDFVKSPDTVCSI